MIQNGLMGYVVGICIFLIIAESILHFVANEQYHKYVRLLVNIMVLAQFIIPVKALLSGEESINIEQTVREFEEKLKENESAVSLEEADLGIYDSVKEEMRIRLNQIEEIKDYQVTRIEWVDNSNQHLKEVSEKIEGIIVYVKRGNTSAGNEAAVQKENVKTIKIQEIRLTGQENETGNETAAESTAADGQLLELRKAFCACLGTEERYMEVRWDG